MSIERIVVSIIAALFQSLAVSLTIFKQLPNYKLKQKLFIFIIVFLYCLASFYIIPNQYRFLLFVTILAFALFLVFKIQNKNVILYSFNTVMILSISEVFITLCLVILGLNSTEIVTNYFLNLIANILISILVIFVINLKVFKNILNKILTLFNNHKSMINYLYIFILGLYLITLKNGLELILKYNYYINLLFIVVVVIILTIIIRNELKYDQINEQNKQMLNYVTKYERIITEKGKANHEFKNQLMVIRGYAQMNKPDKLLEYIDGVVEDSKKTGSSYLISQLNNFPDGGIKGLLYYKLSQMDDFKIKYEINVEEGVKDKLDSLNTAMYNNITKILGVLLDNAIDASRQTRKKKIIITVNKERSNVIFNLYNTYKGKLDISKIGTGYTTKGKNHGYGLRLVKDIVESNKNLNVEKFLEENYYVSKLIIKIPGKSKK